MAKQAGMGDQLLVGGYVLGDDVQSLSRIGGGASPLDVTAITQSAMARLGGIRDGEIACVPFFDPATDKAHDRFGALPTTDTLVSYLRGQTAGKPAACLVAKQINYDGTRAQDGSLLFQAQSLGSGFGLEWVESMTAGVLSQGSAGNVASVDFTAAGSFGLQAYLHVTAFTGTSVTVKLQQSSDNAMGDPFADVTGGGFVAATAPGWQRIATAGGQAVERYLRVVTTGAFSAASFWVGVVVNRTATVF